MFVRCLIVLDWCCSLCVRCRYLFLVVNDCSLFIVGCLLFVACSLVVLLIVVRCSLCIVFCLLYLVCRCLLFVCCC